MATSTFGKQFVVDKKNSRSFVREVCKAVPPTLSKNFKSGYTHLSQDEKLREKLSTVLGK